MKKWLKWWMFLILGVIVAGGLGFAGHSVLWKPRITQIQEAQDATEAANARYQTAENAIPGARTRLANANEALAGLTEAWDYWRAHKMPAASGNAEWRAQRQASAFKPQGVQAQLGESGIPAELDGYQALTFDMLYESTQDLPTLVFDFFNVMGCDLVSPTDPGTAFTMYQADPTGPATFVGHFTVEGGLRRVLAMFRRFGDFPRLASISGVSLTPSTGPMSHRIRADFDLVVYVFPDVPAEGLQDVGPGSSTLAMAQGGGGLGGAGGMGPMGMGMMGPMMGPSAMMGPQMPSGPMTMGSGSAPQ